MKNDENGNIETWMFRAPNEYAALIFSFLLLVVIGAILSSYNIYLAVIIFILGLIYIRLQQAQYLGNAVRVYQNQFPHIFEMFKKNAIQLGISSASLYIVQSPEINAHAIGLTSCSVVLTSGLVEQFTKTELEFVISHELGHFKAGHTRISSIFLPLGSGNIFSSLIFGVWQRKTEYTADRCGLALTRDIDAAISGLIKLAIGGKLFEQFNLEAYVLQIKKADSTPVKFSELLVDHPLITNRIKNLIAFWRESFKKQYEVS